MLKFEKIGRGVDVTEVRVDQRPEIGITFPNVALQTNGYDCGLYAVANATALAYGRDPTTQVYIPRMMRSHLYKCFENKHIEPFPVANTKAKRKSKRKCLMCLCIVFAICLTPEHCTFIVIHVAGNTTLNVLVSKHP